MIPSIDNVQYVFEWQNSRREACYTLSIEGKVLVYIFYEFSDFSLGINTAASAAPAFHTAILF